MCGGSGTRLRPLSRTDFPKQFLCFTAAQLLAGLGNSTIQVALPLITTGEENRFLASEQLREAGISLGSAPLETAGRNTLPALTLTALAAVQNSADPVLVVTPADQTLVDVSGFTAGTQTATEQAAQCSIVILGDMLSQPETGYGYIQVKAGGAAADAQTSVCTVRHIVAQLQNTQH